MKRKVKHLGILAAALALCLTACGKTAAPAETQTPEPTPTQTEKLLPTPTEAVETPAPPEETEAPEASAAPEETEPPEETSQPVPEAPTVPNAVAIYNAILDEVCANIRNGYDWSLGYEGQIGIQELASGMTPEEALRSVGYAITDLSGDGAPELVLGALNSAELPPPYGDMIYTIYGCKDGRPVLVLEGWYRNMYAWLGDGRFYYRGSSGAAYSFFGEAAISADGTAMNWVDFYFTWPTDENFSDIRCYHNTTGEGDPALSEELDMDFDAVLNISDNLEASVRELRLTPLSEYGAEQLPVHIQWADAVPGTEHDSFAAYDGEYAVDVIFTADSPVRDFKFLSLRFADADENGMRFETEELYHMETLTPERPLVVTMGFAGDIPNNGISYVDAEGKTRRFAVEQSGMDGSLILWEF